MNSAAKRARAMNDPDGTGLYHPEDTSETGGAEATPFAAPPHIGRYRVERLLGHGGFGQVYLARDEQLERLVAIKVPHARLVLQVAQAEVYLNEARAVANLDHPHIVPVHDVGSTPQFPCYIVSKYIDGTDLARHLKQARLSLHAAVELVAQVAEAVHHAHQHGLVHRDIKPSNILLDRAGRPFVTDFGLALRERDVGKGPRFAGTPAYMSPEQARGEGHRVDGRSDIFSLGAVFYELLVGRQPFRGDSKSELRAQVATCELRAPRQHDAAIPKELERICLKALAKRAAERYATAHDLAADLLHVLAARQIEPSAAALALTPPLSSVSLRSGTSWASTTPTSWPLTIVPKGLRSFDAHDADFFLELLPGPRDRGGLPDSLRFWKIRIEETDPEQTFAVGLICGPSGCGKSSLVKAGLLPRLAAPVRTVYLEATADDTETRLLNGLRKYRPHLSPQRGLTETLAALRREGGPKVLIVLDQFEQWLHAKKEEENTELVQALRQCDGRGVQCLVLVRDDFWMAIIRFMRELELQLVEGRNSAAVDLFDLDHAQKVLTAFGRAFGKLSEGRDHSKEEHDFLRQALRGLAQDGRVICVRLALFAEMMKGKPWTPASLKKVGGIQGLGVAFLEETFSATSAPPEHRYHQKAARACLQALLPEAVTDIKGRMRSDAELLEASGYRGRPRDFDELILILDRQIRLITPTDPEGMASEEGRVPPGKQERYYQLTHDYLVPSLREWLTRKQRATRRGRAELLLAERAAAWQVRAENRELPSLGQWLRLRCLVPKGTWTPPQRKMMRQASWYQVRRGLLAAVLLGLIGWGGYEGHGMLKAQAFQDRLLDAHTTEVPTIVQELAPYRRWLEPLLREAYQEAEAHQEPRKQLHASLALLPTDPTQQGYLYGRLLDAAPHEAPVLREALAPRKNELADKLWAVAAHPGKGREPQRLRAAAALAAYDPASPRWEKVTGPVLDQWVGENPVYLGLWIEEFRPIQGKMLAPLALIYRDGTRRESERMLATNILADYAAAQPDMLVELLMDADDKQFAVLYPKLARHGWRALAGLRAEVDLPLRDAVGEAAKEKRAKRQANAAVALLRLGESAQVWPLLRHSPDPRVRSYLIHRLGSLGAEPSALLARLDHEPDVTIRRALLLSLGAFGANEWSIGEREAVVEKMRALYRTAADPGLHAAAEWWLRQQGEGTWLAKLNAEWSQDKPRREQRPGADAKPSWYVNAEGQTMVVIPGPLEFTIGSPASEEFRQEPERQYLKRIGRSFAIAAMPVTKECFLRFRPDDPPYEAHRYPEPTCPIAGVKWYEAAAYCNWLSEREGLPPQEWCYEANPSEKSAQMKEKYLSRTGYRLPTEAEMEFATRAGAATSRYYGETEELLPKYAWYFKNSGERAWPVGSKKPNDLGLFDMHGNVWCWCLDREYKERESGKLDDNEDKLAILAQDRRIVRGGSFFVQASSVRCAVRSSSVPSNRGLTFGFRVARTIVAE
jgi:eukaryotic-like serine/threonine-protein kinase